MIAIRTGDAGGNGDRENVVFAQAIPDGTGGNTVGLSMNFVTQSNSSNFINLTAGGTFTGGITTVKGNGNTQRDYLVIGGERFEVAFNANRFNTQGATPSNATLGTTAPGVGSYAGAISLDTGSILTYNSTGTQTLSGAITGGGSLLMSGTGVLTLSGANTYSGGTTFEGNGDNGTGSSGTLRMGAVNALPTTGAVTLSNNAGALLDLDGFNTTIGSLAGGGATGGNVNLGANGVLTVGNATSTTVGSLISGTGTAGLTKQGFSTLTLSSTGTHTYTGPTNVTQGTLALTGNLSSSDVTVNGFAKLSIPTAAVHTLGTNVNFANNSTLQLECAGLTVGSVSVTGNLDVLDNPTLKLVSTGSFTAPAGAYTVVGAGALTANQAAWTLDASVINDNAPDKTSNWKNNPVTDVLWDTADNWSQQLYGGTVDYVGTDLKLNLTKYNIAPVVTTQVTIAPTNTIAVTGPAAPTTVASLTLGTSAGPAHSLAIQSGGTLTVNGTVTLNPTGFLTAASGNEVVVKGKFASGSVAITAGVTPFKIGGTNMTAGANVVTNLDNLIVEGGTTKIANAAISTISLVDSGSAWGGGATNPVSNNFTVSAGANVLIVNIACRQAAANGSYIGGPAPVVTYGGVPLTLATFGESPTQFFVDAWVYYMYNPTTGSSLPLSTTFTSPNANTDFAVSALSLGGVDTGTAPKVGNGNSGGDNVSVTVNNIATNSWLNSVAAMRTNLATINQTVTSGTYGSLLNTGPGGGGNAFWLQNANGGNMSAGGMLMTGITSSSVTINSQVGGSFRWGAAAAAFAPTIALFAINQPTTAVDVTGTNTLDLGAAPAVTLGTLTMNDSSSLTLTNTPAASVSFNSIVGTGTGAAQIGGSLPVSISTGNVTVNSGHALTMNATINNGATGLNKLGSGTLALAVANTYTGVTTVSGGVLRVNHVTGLPGGVDNAVAGGSPLTLNGGVVGLGSTVVGPFNRALGVADTEVQFTGSGGFAAYTDDNFVNLGGGGAVTWGAGGFVPNGSSLILGAADANKTIDFQNGINLCGVVRTVQVDNGSAATDGRLTGAITGTGVGGLTKTGAGTLNLDFFVQNYNTLNATEGTTNVNGELGAPLGSAVVTVSNPGTSLKFGSVSQTLSSLTIGAGTTVTFTSGFASFSGGPGGKAPSFGGASTVPEPGTIGLLLVGALGMLKRRRRTA